MSDIFSLLDKINALRGTLEAITYTLYFDPTNSNQVPGFTEITGLTAEIVDLCNTLSNPTPSIPS